MGDRSERTLCRMFGATDHWRAQRAAASGSATDAELPDVTFAHDGIAFAAEEKTTSEPYIYLDPEEVDALEAYATSYGMTPVVLGRFKRGSDGLPTGASSRAFYAWNPDAMERTDAGTYRGSPTDEAWAAKIAEPDGTAAGILPGELSSFYLYHALRGDLSGQVTAPPETRAETSASTWRRGRMTELVCMDCGRSHEPGLTGISSDGKPTCVDCNGRLRREESGGEP